MRGRTLKLIDRDNDGDLDLLNFCFLGEPHSGRDTRIVNSVALGFPDEVAANGITMGYIGNRQWKVAGNI